MGPKRVHRLDQVLHVILAMHRRGSEAQSFRASWHGRVVDGLNVDPVIFEQHVGKKLGMHGIPDDDWHDMAAMIDERQAKRPEPRLQDTGLHLQLVPPGLIRLQDPDRRRGTGRNGVKMNPGA